MVFLPLMTMHLPKYAPFRAMVSYAAAPLSPWRSATGPSAVPPAPPCRSPGPLCILSQCSRLVRSRPTPQGAGRFRPSSIRAAALPCRIPQAYSPPPGTNSRFSPIGTGLAGSLKKRRGILRGSSFAKERTYRAPGGCYCRRAPGQLPLSLARCFF